MDVYVFISIVFLCVIVGFEGWRRVSGYPIGLLSVANLIFALNFFVSPLLLAYVPGTDYAIGPFGQVLFILPIVKELALSSESYTQTAVIAFSAYVLMVGVYLLVEKRLHIRPLYTKDIPVRWLAVGGIVLATITVVALLKYSSNFNNENIGGQYQFLVEQYLGQGGIDDGFGLVKMLKLGILARSDRLDIQWGFLQIVVMLGVPGFIMLSSAGLRLKGVWRGVLLALAVISWAAVVMRTYHAAGRMEFGIVMSLVPLAVVLSSRSRITVLIGVFGLFVFGMFIGLASHAFFPDPGQVSVAMVQALGQQFGRSVLYMANEFAFPFPVVANTLVVVPEVIGYRYFIDIPLAALYMLPNLGSVDAWPEMISHIHERIVPMLLPYDLISFGYYSGGVIGVGLVFVAMGALLALFDAWLRPGTGWLVQCLRAAWMMYLPFRIMYADPYTSMKTGFGLIVGTILILGMVELAKRRAVRQ